MKTCASCGQVLPQNIYKFGQLELDTNFKVVYKNGEIIMLSRGQYAILEFLMKHKNMVLSRDQILTAAWGYPGREDYKTRAIDMHIGYLRKKLGREYIVTRRGFGYMFQAIKEQ